MADELTLVDWPGLGSVMFCVGIVVFVVPNVLLTPVPGDRQPCAGAGLPNELERGPWRRTDLSKEPKFGSAVFRLWVEQLGTCTTEAPKIDGARR